MKIENGRYWNLGWQLIDGCTPCSPGCEHCWSASMAHRFMREGEPGHETGILTDNRGRFNSTIICHADRLDIPLKRKKPTVYSIWNDLYHPNVLGLFICHAYDQMIMERRHTFLVLTKRPIRMEIFINNTLLKTFIPPVNIYHGLTICNQKEADEKIPIFLQVPGKKFLSIEPMLSRIEIDPYWLGGAGRCGHNYNMPQIDAVILGGETGPGARPMHPDWVRSIRDQCAAASVPFFFQQWGEWCPALQTTALFRMDKVKSHDFGDILPVFKVGKKKAGRLLDDREHNDLPWVG